MTHIRDCAQRKGCLKHIVCSQSRRFKGRVSNDQAIKEGVRDKHRRNSDDIVGSGQGAEYSQQASCGVLCPTLPRTLSIYPSHLPQLSVIRPLSLSRPSQKISLSHGSRRRESWCPYRDRRVCLCQGWFVQFLAY
jgi:hypothetical protein